MPMARQVTVNARSTFVKTIILLVFDMGGTSHCLCLSESYTFARPSCNVAAIRSF
ncbi:MAG: hypothetical protein QG574_4704, partial [Cyanobacteriota bacterium erpe_2018_sw_21hr_WHONDRS-SW48-000092_B_bin.40]|nr:hypothetical protein [Cyanobacteriota bacterium erpe_2018_sw_21hr_WHONDRS-SW48-000092_B_bin.40]